MQSSQNDPNDTTSPQANPQPVDGVPLIEATARDFIQVRAALVRRFQNADDALVWTRIHWRTDGHHRDTYDVEGRTWWAPKRDTIADETGLKPSQVRRALERLEKGGYIIGEHHRRGGPYDRTKSYTAVVAEMAGMPSGNAAGAISGKADVTDLEGAVLPDVPSIKTPQRGETNTLLVPFEESEELKSNAAEILGFDLMWEAWPRNESKAAARKAFAKAIGAVAVKDRRARAEMISGAACAWGRGAAARRDAGQFQPIPYLASWLNQQRWEEDAPKLDPVASAGFDRDLPTQRVQSALELGARMDEQQSAQYDLVHQTESRRGAISR